MAGQEDAPDRFASGSGTTAPRDEQDDLLPGETGGERVHLPDTGGAAQQDSQGTAASSAEGTIGAVGEMDLTGAPADSRGAGNTGETEGGGPGGGAKTGSA